MPASNFFLKSIGLSLGCCQRLISEPWIRPPVNLLVSGVMNRAFELANVLELSTVKFTALDSVFFLPTVTVALY